jgi:hypothetical protein
MIGERRVCFYRATAVLMEAAVERRLFTYKMKKVRSIVNCYDNCLQLSGNGYEGLPDDLGSTLKTSSPLK